MTTPSTELIVDQSFPKPLLAQCPDCDHRHVVDLWMIVDGVHRPDLLEQVAQRSINYFACPACGEIGGLNGPLLVYSGPEKPLLFGQDPGATEELLKQQRDGLVGRLRKRLAAEWTDQLEQVDLLSFEELAQTVREQVSASPDSSTPKAVTDLEDATCSEEVVQYMHDKGVDLAAQFGQKGDTSQLTFAIIMLRETVARTRLDAPLLARRLMDLGATLRDRYSVEGSSEDLDEAVSDMRRAMELLPATSDEQPVFRFLLGLALSDRYERDQDAKDLEDSIAYLSEAQAGVSKGSKIEQNASDLLDYLHQTRNLLRADATSTESARSSAIISESSCQFYETDEPLQQLILQFGSIDNAAELQRFVEDNPQITSRRVDELLHFTILGARNEQNERTANALEYRRTLLEKCREVGVDAAFAESEYDEDSQLALIREYMDCETLSKSRWILEQNPQLLTDVNDEWLDELMAAQDQEYYQDLVERQIGLLRRAREVGIEAAFDELVTIDLPGDLEVLDDGSLTYTAPESMLESFNEEIEHLTTAAKSANPGSTNHLEILNRLGDLYRSRFSLNGDPDDIDAAVKCYEEFLERHSGELSDKLGALNNLVLVTSALYEQSRDLEMMARAIAYAEQAVQLAQAHPEYLGDAQAGLALCLTDRHDEIGDDEDLDRAIELYEAAIENAADDSAVPFPIRSNFAHALRTRYRRRYDFADLERATNLYREAAHTSARKSQERARSLIDLGAVLVLRHEVSKVSEELEEAIRVTQKGLALLDSSSPIRHWGLITLGAALISQNADQIDIKELESGIELMREAVDQTPASSAQYFTFLSNLAAGLLALYEARQSLPDLKDSIRYSKEAFALAGSDSPHNQLKVGHNLGQSLMRLHSVEPTEETLHEAIAMMRRNCELGSVLDPAPAMHSAVAWGAWATERREWAEAAEAYRLGVDAVAALLNSQALRSGQEKWLNVAASIHSRAAHALSRSGKPLDAALVMERGRAVIFSEILELQFANLEQLDREGHSGLTDQFKVASQKVRDATKSGSGVDAASAQTHRDKLASVIESIRSLTGHGDFLAPLEDADVLANAAAGSSLVYVTAAESEGVAIIYDEELGARETILPLLDESSLADHLATFLQAYARRTESVELWKNAISEITRWLWDAAMEPILGSLDPKKPAVLIPAGFLALLPLHAAWTKDRQTVTKRCYAFDRVCFSYAPNARALLSARRRSDQTATSILVIEEPKPTSEAALRYSRLEADAAIDSFATSQRLSHRKATRKRVLSELGDYGAIHFCCHGRADIAEPLKSRLVMSHDRYITLKDLMDAPLENTRLGILSACESAYIGSELPDEVVSLPTGMMQAGVAGVIGSLWSVGDAATAELMTRFYQLWRRDDKEQMDPARALIEAQQWMRDKTNAEKRDHWEQLLNEERASQAAQQFYRAAALRAPKKREHADPYHWAAFVYIGA